MMLAYDHERTHVTSASSSSLPPTETSSSPLLSATPSIPSPAKISYDHHAYSMGYCSSVLFSTPLYSPICNDFNQGSTLTTKNQTVPDVWWCVNFGPSSTLISSLSHT